MRIGIFAFQGDVREHVLAMRRALGDGGDVIEVRREQDLVGLNGLVIPGGESTTITTFLSRVEDVIRDLAGRIAIWGTCAGAIALSSEVLDPRGGNDPRVSPLGLISMATRRNFYGSQNDSFETTVTLEGIGGFPAVFIRAPAIVRTWGDARPLGTFGEAHIMVRERNLLATTFHPELVPDTRVHRYFLSMVEEVTS
ncbi:MAG TPA: pyridoxal 5'-phosphate synthase glutaminase subunit PdxT [Thermoplasmata archaeon]|nr:pyridoxal 5'-phosphate synthase glutaminase subunit PdxT [Thermoplasmata archaeon]